MPARLVVWIENRLQEKYHTNKKGRRDTLARRPIKDCNRKIRRDHPAARLKPGSPEAQSAAWVKAFAAALPEQGEVHPTLPVSAGSSNDRNLRLRYGKPSPEPEPDKHPA